MQEKVALLVPTKVTAAGAKDLLDQLKKANIKVLGRDQNLIVVPFDKAIKQKLLKVTGIDNCYCDEVPKSAVLKLPPESQRLAELWNWSIITKRKQVTDASVKSFMLKLGLEIDKKGYVIDKKTKKSLGKIGHGEKVVKQSNWVIAQWRYWGWAPGFLGKWRMYGTQTITYINKNHTGREIVDKIIAEVDGPHHYAYTKKYNNSDAYAYNWSYIWDWESDWCEHWSWAKKDNVIKQIISKTIFKA